MIHQGIAAASLALALVATAGAANVVIPVDDAASSLTIELCVSGSCDDDTSSVSGTMDFDLDMVDSPSTITLNDLNLVLDENININISFGILGGLTATGTNVTVDYSTPGFSIGPVPIAADAFTLPNVEVIPGGDLNYNATGLVCTLLTGSNLPCNDSIDLSMNGPQIIDMVPGQITSVNREVTVTVDLDFTAPLDPTSPDLGSYQISGTVTGSVTVPACDGDANGDEQVNFDDLNIVLENWNSTVTPGTSGDLTGDGMVNFDDLNLLLENWGEEC